MRIHLHSAGASPYGGYGKLKLAVWQALINAGVDVLPLGAGFSVPSDGTPALLFATPANLTVLEPRPCRPWLYTMAESDAIRPAWVEQINMWYERVIVPAPPLVEVFQRSGVTVPVHYAPLGVDFAVPDVVDNRDRSKTVVLTYSLGGNRKGADLALAAFKLAFGQRPDCELWIKCSKPDGTWLAGCNDPQVKVISGNLEEHEWHALLAQADMFVFPSRGEGFGLPPREATLAGVPTIVPAWLGLWDAAEWAYTVHVDRLMPVSFSEPTVNADAARWCEPRLTDLAGLMLWVDMLGDEARAHAQRGRAYLLEHFTYAHTARAIADLLELYPVR